MINDGTMGPMKQSDGIWMGLCRGNDHGSDLESR